MKKLKTDILIIGGGPVGCTAGRFAALGGADVIIAEKRQEIGSPVRCGEGIAADIFPEIGLEENEQWIRNRVEGARLISASGNIWTVEGKDLADEVGMVIDRDKFDKDVAAWALSAGARIMLQTSMDELMVENGQVRGCRGTCSGENITITAGIVIAADGYESTIAHQAGLDTKLDRKDVETCLQYTLGGVDHQTKYCDFYLGGKNVPGGYIWVFPKSRTEVNVGLGIQLSRIEQKGMVKKYLDRFVKQHPVLKEGSPISMVGGGVSVSKPMKKTISPGFMVVGDAARMIDPLTGGGLANGLIAARWAGKVGAEAIKKGDKSESLLQKYETGWRNQLEEKMYRNYMAKELLLKQSDETVDNILHTLGTTKMEEVGTFEIIQAISEKHPEVMKQIEKYFLEI